ncbi:MAG: DNA polymerase III subunit beta [Gammaproteobacteria bacterium]|nr:DNA polymerase III subunit beta [Gammaproteobacteria bacterium]MCW8924586.1 DNA polymerase III subunit beta [Gammaproteobacteria bacterium]
MKFQIQRDNLLNSLQQIIGAVEKRQTMPALSNVLIKAGNESLSLTATDLEIEFVTSLNLLIDQPGEITVPARKLLDICKSLPVDSQMDITIKDDKAMIQSGRSRFSLVTLPANDFPSLDEISSNSEFEIPQMTLKDIIDKTAFAMAQQDVRYYLNGLMLEVGSNVLRAVATDGHRLAYCEKQTDFELADLKQVILPRKGVLELARLLDTSEDKVKIILGNNHLRVELDDLRFTSKLIDGRFPDYNRVIPDDGNCVMTAEREVLKQALIRASILSNEKYRGIRLILEDNLVRLQAHNPDQEEADVDIEVDYQGDNLEIGFNVNYMIDALNASTSETTQLTLRDSNSSCLLTYPDQPDCKYVIMPMRL